MGMLPCILPVKIAGEPEEGSPTGKLLQNLLSRSSIVGRLLEETLTADAVLTEATCIVSEPGAPAQMMHADQHFPASLTTTNKMITIFFAPEDIWTEDRGATR